MRTVAIAKAKANLLTIVKQVEGRRESFTLTRNGKPVAKLVPLDDAEDPLAVFHFPGIKVTGDIVSPAFDDEDWDDAT